MFMIFKNRNDEKPKETIILKNCGVCAERDATFRILGKISTVLDVNDSEGKHRKGKCTSYKMTADDHMEKVDWMKALMLKMC
jgi:transcriptional regulator of NAD metabolism